MSPIPDAVIPPDPVEDPTMKLWLKMSEIANKALRQEISVEEWEKQIKEATGK